LCGRDYTKENSERWATLKDFIITRNFYIHYEPVTWEQYDNHTMKLSKESFRYFMECAKDVNSFLIECKNKERRTDDEHVNQLKNLLLNAHNANINEKTQLEKQLNSSLASINL